LVDVSATAVAFFENESTLLRVVSREFRIRIIEHLGLKILLLLAIIVKIFWKATYQKYSEHHQDETIS